MLKRRLVDKGAGSEICEKEGIAPTRFHQWWKQFFQNGGGAFDRSPSKPDRREAQRIEALEAKLRNKDEVVDYVNHWRCRAELPAARLIGWLGISNSKFYDWRRRYGQANEHNGRVPRDFWLTDDEKQVIVRCHFDHPLALSLRAPAGRLPAAGVHDD